MAEIVAGRAYARAYKTPTRADLSEYVVQAVEASGSEVLYTSDPQVSPFYLGILTPGNERLGVLAYLFRSKAAGFTNRPSDERRVIMRYGDKPVWEDGNNALGFDDQRVDTTVILAIDHEMNALVGLDPLLYDPLTLGISLGYKQHHMDALVESFQGWYAFERNTRGGTRRVVPKGPHQVETVVLFRPERLIDYVRLERVAAELQLDPALRLAAADQAEMPAPTSQAVASLHALERQFEMSSSEILGMISERARLSTAVRGGVAEFHLNKILRTAPGVLTVVQLDKDGAHDFDVTMQDGRVVSIECKNASTRRFKDGAYKVDLQKTRHSRDDPSSRFYRPDQFDVVAACLWGAEGRWVFRYRRASELPRHEVFPDKLAAIQRVTDDWAATLEEAL